MGWLSVIMIGVNCFGFGFFIAWWVIIELIGACTRLGTTCLIVRFMAVFRFICFGIRTNQPHHHRCSFMAAGVAACSVFPYSTKTTPIQLGYPHFSEFKSISYW